MNFLSIDPGINTGVALWKKGYLIEVQEFNTKSRDISLDALTLGQAFGSWLEREFYSKIEKTYIEYPALWAGSETSMVAATSGALVKLAVIVGVLTAHCHTRNIPVVFLTPQQWKGQLSKEAVALRLQRNGLGPFQSTHQMDAVGIGLHVLGKFSAPAKEIKAFSKARKR